MPDSIQTLLTAAGAELAAGSDTPELDAEVLLACCLGRNRSYLRAWPEKQPDAAQHQRFLELTARRRAGWPVAYLTGRREFWSREFKVGPEVLIPRPDSELLIELALALLPATADSRIVDLGTGSGILAVTLAVERPRTRILATDVSAAALAVASENAARLGAGNVRFLLSDWFAAVPAQQFDLVISNPPYIAADDPHLRQGDVRFEPDTALVSSDNGLADIRRLAAQARSYLTPGGQLLVEHGYAQQADVQTLFADLGYAHIVNHCDLAGRPRVTTGIMEKPS